ncbi:hypothetical protein SEA_ROSIEPOSIE_59 [Arthrobacter phage RosiePosie]|uniref:Uncharacterized protein n=10 Tax=Klausavirus princesstrina TaxID=1984784 RepID=A0A1J0GSY0_9CAUD|nr:hypothetical protein FDI82_gp060 [Arthrobacter phage PrincessTrina]ANU79662.1 hypothetical protein SEA_CONBOY_59 [Arthrobacter phage Conboy]AOZ64614.1 hypothetical protein SEA_CHUBSTER_61 [Arthrobacter phage Chubster]AOZ64725.1 hypothetical protein SEA_CHOCOLAT_60 [Arthrobacter phage Chocolat]APC44743.1 hypothetical protein SEA_EDGARPOE_59 [Arthrobacter phage EdgarPoe]ASX98845.1 hypothetical protein SEA_KABREEZE_60 [Arthrobacter phage Kabreeze]ASX98955.1 hypothetical protein SEA_ROSIEPOSIE
MSKNLKPQPAPIQVKQATPRIVIDPVEPSVILDLQRDGVFLKFDPEAARKLGMALASGAARAEGKTKGHVIMTFVEDEK